MNIYEKLSKARATLELKKTGVATVNNAGKTRSYFSLDDILPSVNKTANELKFLCKFDLNKEIATLKIIDCEKIEDFIEFSIPASTATIQGGNVVQSIGATQTYLRRYLYLNAFEIAEYDVIEEETTEDKKPLKNQQAQKQAPKNSDKWTKEQNDYFVSLVEQLPEKRKEWYRKNISTMTPKEIIDIAKSEVEFRKEQAEQQAEEQTGQQAEAPAQKEETKAPESSDKEQLDDIF